MSVNDMPDGWDYLPVRALATIERRSINPEKFPSTVFADYSMPSYDNERRPESLLGSQIDSVRNSISGSVVLVNKLNVRKERIWYVQSAKINAVCTSEFVPLIPKKEVDGNFLHYALSNPMITQKLCSLSNGSTNSQVRIKPYDIFTLRIMVPNLRTQLQISSFLDEQNNFIDDTISRHRLIINKLEDYRHSVISHAVAGDSSGLDNTRWTWKRFKFIAHVDSNLVEPDNYPHWLHISPESIGKGNGRLLRTSTVYEDGVTSYNHLFHKGAILYSKVRPRLNKVIIAPDNGLCSADMYPISTSQLPEWLKYYMLSNQFVEQAGLVSDIRIKMPKINQQELGNLKVFVPPRQDQLEIISYLDYKCAAIDEGIDRQEQVIARLEEYRRSLIFHAVTGRIDCMGGAR